MPTRRPWRPPCAASASSGSTDAKAASAMAAARSMRATSLASLTARSASTAPRGRLQLGTVEGPGPVLLGRPCHMARPRGRRALPSATSAAATSASRWVRHVRRPRVDFAAPPPRRRAARQPGSGTGRRWSARPDLPATSSVPAEPPKPVSQRTLAGVVTRRASTDRPSGPADPSLARRRSRRPPTVSAGSASSGTPTVRRRRLAHGQAPRAVNSSATASTASR